MTAPLWEARADLVVVGTGVAGLTAAIEGRALGLRVLLVTKATPDEGSTRFAQGGVAAVLDEDHDAADSVSQHVADTVTAGAGLCDELAVREILADGDAAIARLRRQGAEFDTDRDGRLARTREGGHSTFRIIRAGGDATGAEVERALLRVVCESDGSTLPILSGHVVTRLAHARSGAVGGVHVIDDHGRPGLVRAAAVLLATGGAGQLYEVSTNPDVATADGVALALRAGAVVSDLEFVQFHPTVLYTGTETRGQGPLVTEAVRGEGAVLIDATGARVMVGVHPLADLAPRDVVSAAITRHLASAPGGIDNHVFLDARHFVPGEFRGRFPTVHSSCVAIGIDPDTDPIPVAPAAHFACGGVVATVDGRTSVPGLYAAGEVARTGLHGANRLASNSLLEGLVVGPRTARAIAHDLGVGLLDPRQALEYAPAPAVAVADRTLVQRVMSRYAAIGRTSTGLDQALSLIEQSSVTRVVGTRRDVEDAALTLVARCMVRAAVRRTESRGCHVRTDHAGRDDVRWRRSQRLRLDVSGQPLFLEPTVVDGVA